MRRDVMPPISAGSAPDAAFPHRRILAARKQLAIAALLLSLMLLASNFATLLIPEPDYRIGVRPVAGPWPTSPVACSEARSSAPTILPRLQFCGLSAASSMAGLLSLVHRHARHGKSYRPRLRPSTTDARPPKKRNASRSPICTSRPTEVDVTTKKLFAAVANAI